MPFTDLREFMQALERSGELLTIDKEVRLEPDIGAMGAAIAELNERGINALMMRRKETHTRALTMC